MWNSPPLDHDQCIQVGRVPRAVHVYTVRYNIAVVSGPLGGALEASSASAGVSAKSEVGVEGKNKKLIFLLF